VGNESWGCGGNMRPEYYSDLYRRFNTFVKNYPGNRIFRIACGSNGGDYNWTDVLMQQVGRRMDGLSLHYYTIPTGNWRDKGPATGFGEAEWHASLRRSLELDGLVSRHAAIMDQHDPGKRVGMMVDEWGVWTNVEPGTNPGFLYQQNSLRDALVAGISLNIFNRHCDRVRMANIAQTVNVLQAMVLTREEKMVLTPTFHVYEMYTVHHDATLLTSTLTTPDYAMGSDRIPAVHTSASRDEGGTVHITLCNLDANRSVDLTCTLPGIDGRNLSGRVLTAPSVQSHNTFDEPDLVAPADFSAFQATDEGFTTTLPPKSVVALAIGR
jgi:alpha-N-arabinofuranosidase